MTKQLFQIESESDLEDTKPLLELTGAAKLKILSIMKETAEVQGLRISIQGHSNRTFQYNLEFVIKVEPDDIIVDCGDFRIFVDSANAENLTGTLIDYVETLNTSGFRFDNPNVPPWDDPKMQAIQELIETQVNPAVASHGGNITLVNVTTDAVYLEMSGGCQGCSLSSITLQHGVRSIIQEAFPEIKHIIDTTDHSSGTNPYYQSSER